MIFGSFIFYFYGINGGGSSKDGELVVCYIFIWQRIDDLDFFYSGSQMDDYDWVMT